MTSSSQKKKKTGKGLLGKMLGFMLRDIKKLNPSKMSFLWNRKMDVQEDDEG